MRKEFADNLKQEMEKNKDIWMLLGGVGYGFWQEGGQVINCEASEVAMVNIAIGMALEGKIPFVYAITPHLYRAFEQIRNYLNFEKIPVKLIGVGQNEDYGTLGFTHYATDASDVFKLFPNICTHYSNFDIKHFIESGKPEFINLPR